MKFKNELAPGDLCKIFYDAADYHDFMINNTISYFLGIVKSNLKLYETAAFISNDTVLYLGKQQKNKNYFQRDAILVYFKNKIVYFYYEPFLLPIET